MKMSKKKSKKKISKNGAKPTFSNLYVSVVNCTLMMYIIDLMYILLYIIHESLCVCVCVCLSRFLEIFCAKSTQANQNPTSY